MEYTYKYTCEIGDLFITADNEALLKLEFSTNKINFESNSIIKNTVNQLNEYFLKKRKTFDIPLKLNGTEFQKKVWLELQKIPYGKTCSYKEIAKSIGCPMGARAVGNANNKNNIAIIIPCHRVIGSNRSLIGYAAGLEIKKKLLKLEGIIS